MRFIFIFPLLFTICTSYGQKKPKTKDDGVEIIDFGENKSSVRKTRETDYQNIIIKTGPFTPVFGKSLVEIEKEISGNFSFQVSLGLMHKRYIPSLSSILEFEEDFLYCSSTQWAEDVCDNHNTFDEDLRKSGLGFMVGFSPRFWFGDDGFEDSYISVNAAYHRQPYDARSVVETRNSLTYSQLFDIKERFSYIDLTTRIGAQYLGARMTFEYFIGLGVRLRNDQLIDVGRDNLFVYRNGTTKIKDSGLLVEGGCRVGFRM
jgi:hypothetical protein